jgi:hypothetical protein
VGGVTNSRPTPESWNGSLCSDAGVDTVRFRWRTDPEAYEVFRHRKGGYIEGQRGEVFTQTELGRIGAFRDGLFYIESRAAALVDGSRDSHRLARPDELPAAERVALQVCYDNEAFVGEDEARLGRIDLASELRFSRGSAGRAFLHSLSAADVPWCKSRTDGRKGEGIETVSFHGTTGKTVYLRAYDKGIESGTAPAGERIRVERQRRFRKTREPSLAMLSSADLHSMYIGREFAHLQNLKTATVCDVEGAIETLWERAESAAQFERMIGFIVAGNVIDYGHATRYARAAELRSLGIFVDHTQRERLEVPVGRYLQTLSSAWAA